jgi:ABC-type oligopeptide transport system substrate-binding subunit
VLQAWREHLDIDVRWCPQVAEGAPLPLNASPAPERPQLFLGAYSADYPDPDCFLRLAFPWQETGWHHPVYERLLTEARRAHNLDRRLEFYRAADRILMEQAPLFPLYQGASPFLVKPWVLHYPVSGTRWSFYKDVVLGQPD